jgi:hypothetical protein
MPTEQIILGRNMKWKTHYHPSWWRSTPVADCCCPLHPWTCQNLALTMDLSIWCLHNWTYLHTTILLTDIVKSFPLVGQISSVIPWMKAAHQTVDHKTGKFLKLFARTMNNINKNFSLISTQWCHRKSMLKVKGWVIWFIGICSSRLIEPCRLKNQDEKCIPYHPIPYTSRMTQ